MLPPSRKYDYLDSALHPPKASIPAEPLLAHTICRWSLCVGQQLQQTNQTLRWYPQGGQGAAAASSGIENWLLDQARRKMLSPGLISLLCLVNLKLSQIYLHLITVTHLREYHPASQQNTTKIFCTWADLGKNTFSRSGCPWFMVILQPIAIETTAWSHTPTFSL